MIYLDNAATTKIDPEVLNEMEPYLTHDYGNAGSLHSKGRDAYNAVKKAREQVADFIHASPDQIVFTGSGSEANNMVINNAMYHILNGKKFRIVTTPVEHDSILNPLKVYRYGLNLGFMTDYLRLDDYEQYEDEYQKNIVPNKNQIQLVSVMRTNNETGVFSPVYAIGEVCSALHIPFHTDCVQAAGYGDMNVHYIKCDFMTLSAHKIHGPKGVGALFVKDPKNFFPLIHGGKAQEFGLRGGTENIAGIVGFGKACEMAKADTGAISRIDSLVSVFVDVLRKEIDRLNADKLAGIRYAFNSPVTATKVINVRFDGIMAETLIMMLDSQGICVSAGSACNASDGTPSHVLKAIGLTDEQARSSIRVSFSRFNTNDDAIQGAKAIAKCVHKLKNM